MRLARPKDGSFTLSDSSSTSAKAASQVERAFRGGCPTRYFPNTVSRISFSKTIQEGIPKNMTKSYWSNVATRWNSNADSNVWIKLLGTTDIQSQFTGVKTVRFDWGENICPENVEINSAPLYPPYPTWFHGKSIFEVGKVNCVAPSINKRN